MSIAKELPDVHPFFMQDCPLCGRSNRMVVKGLYVYHGKVEQYPDMGYSFCNCRNIFYTRSENITDEASYLPDDNGMVTLPDPFFAWPNPHDFLYWNVRRYPILWDMEEYCRLLEEIGYEVIWARRDMSPESATPQHFHIRTRK